MQVCILHKILAIDFNTWESRCMDELIRGAECLHIVLCPYVMPVGISRSPSILIDLILRVVEEEFAPRSIHLIPAAQRFTRCLEHWHTVTNIVRGHLEEV